MLTKLLIHKALEISGSRAPDFLIGDHDVPYLARWYWFPRNRFFNIYIHRFFRDDDDRALHDHPWPSLSLTASGSLREIYIGEDGNQHVRTISEGDWTYRPAEFAHRLEIPEQEGSPMTLFMIGPKIRDWGFHCPKGWRRWQDFVATDRKGAVGRGCGEMDD